MTWVLFTLPKRSTSIAVLIGDDAEAADHLGIVGDLLRAEQQAGAEEFELVVEGRRAFSLPTVSEVPVAKLDLARC